MAHKRKGSGDPISTEFIQKICTIYGDHYDDRLEDSRPPAAGKKNGQSNKRLAGEDWEPGMPAAHKSLAAFQKELVEKHGISLSTSKIRKLLVSGGCWSTERSREVQALYDELTQPQSGVKPEKAIEIISTQLGISKVTVDINLSYINGVNRLENKSKNAVRCAKYRKKKQESSRHTSNETMIFKL